MNPTTDQLRIIVIGAGLAGLTVAWALKSSGHEVTVLEKSPQLATGGAEIQVAPNATRCLDKMGLLPYVKHVGNPISHMEARSWRSMDIQSRVQLNARGDYGSTTFRRDDLIQALYEAAVKSGVEVRFNIQAVELDETEPSVTAKNGEKFSADLIVGVDGVRSTLRSLMFPDRDTKPIITDTACFQTCVPVEVLAKDPETLALWHNHRGIGVQMGDGKYMTSWRNEHRQALFVIFSQRHYDKPVDIDDWTRRGDSAEVLQLYSDFPAAVQTLIRNMDSWEKWRIVDAVEGADWVSASGKVVLAGDAIHAMPPHAAQGYGQGVEDAASLSMFLAYLRDRKHLSKFMNAWAKLREPRASHIQAAARASLDGFTLPDGPAQRARDEAYQSRHGREKPVEEWNRSAPETMVNPNLTQAEFTRWVYFYDVIEEAKKVTASLNAANWVSLDL